LKRKAAEQGVCPLALVKVIAMHWNSHVSCILQILDLRKVLDCLCIDPDLDLWDFIFSEVEWKIMDDLEDILEVSKYHYIHWSSFTNLTLDFYRGHTQGVEG
jgi:hypothetical protein